MKDSQGDAIDFLPGRRRGGDGKDTRGKGSKEKKGCNFSINSIKLKEEKNAITPCPFCIKNFFFSLPRSILCYSTFTYSCGLPRFFLFFWVYEPAPAVRNIRVAEARTNWNREHSDSKRRSKIVRKNQHSKNIHQSSLHLHSRELWKDTFSVQFLFSHSPDFSFLRCLRCFLHKWGADKSRWDYRMYAGVGGTTECMQEGRQEKKERMFMTHRQSERERLTKSEKKEPKKIEWE